jgi:hypothetical protein
MSIRRWVLGSLGVFTVGAASSIAMAHATGHEARTADHCARLSSAGERQACVQCVTRPLRHHYHPEYPAGNRCRPDNGRP